MKLSSTREKLANCFFGPMILSSSQLALSLSYLAPRRIASVFNLTVHTLQGIIGPRTGLLRLQRRTGKHYRCERANRGKVVSYGERKEIWSQFRRNFKVLQIDKSLARSSFTLKRKTQEAFAKKLRNTNRLKPES